MRRRDLILGAMALGGLGAAEALRPRKRLVLLKNGTIDEALPREFGTWTSQDTTLINPGLAGRLSKTLYSETVSRVYYNSADETAVMLLIAYGDTQSDLLQLHRPESCYPAVGFGIQMTKPAEIPIAAGASVPGRNVIAASEDRVESIVYWTRLGERLPRSGGEQRTARLENAMEGYVADGALIRCSTLGEPDAAFKILNGFVPAMLRAVKRPQLPAFIGTRLAQRVV